MYKTTVATLDEFRDLRPVWNRLLLESEYPIVFLTWEWIYTWWEQFGEEGRLPIILVVSDGEEIKGILPLYSQTFLLQNYWLSGRVLAFCSAMDLFPDHVDIIAAPAHAHECIRSIVDFLVSEHRSWDVIRLPMITSSCQLFRYFTDDGMRIPGMLVDVEESSRAYFIPIAESFDRYLGRLEAKQRYNLRTRARKLYEQHGVRYAGAEADPLEYLQYVFSLHRQRAARKGIESSFMGSKVYEFHRAFAARVAANDWLSIRVLKRGAEVIAASYNFEYAGRVFSYQKGFDPAWERYGPGSVLVYELIREAFERGRREYNFLQGAETYKGSWARDFRRLSTILCFNNTPLGHLAHGKYHLRRVVKRLGDAREGKDASREQGQALDDKPTSGRLGAPSSRGDAKYVQEVNDIEELQVIKGEWDALVDAMRYPTVFCTWEWCTAWWRHFGIGRRLRLFLIRQKGELRGVLPLYSEAKFLGTDGRIGRVLGYCGAADLFPDPLDLVAAQEDSRGCADAVAQYLEANSGGWDILHLRYLTEDSDMVQSAMNRTDERAVVQRISGAPYIPLSGSYEAYLRGLSANERGKISRSRRKLMGEQGAVYCNIGAEDRERALESLVRLHELRATERGIRSSFARTRVLNFHRDLLERIDSSQIWLRALRVGTALVAVYYGFALNGRVSYFQLGHDPEWGRFSPGAVLLQETIREAYERGYQEYNFLQGEESFKVRWTQSVRSLYAIDVFNDSALGWLSLRAVNTRRWLKSRLVAERPR